MWGFQARHRLDDVLSGLPLTAKMLSDVHLPPTTMNLLALLFFLNRHADHRACVTCLIDNGEEVHDDERG